MKTKTWRELKGVQGTKILKFDEQMLDEVEAKLVPRPGWTFRDWVFAAKKRGIINHQQAAIFFGYIGTTLAVA